LGSFLWLIWDFTLHEQCESCANIDVSRECRYFFVISGFFWRREIWTGVRQNIWLLKAQVCYSVALQVAAKMNTLLGYGVTSLFKLKLSPGAHEVLLVNEAEGVRQKKVVNIESGQTQKINWSLCRWAHGIYKSSSGLIQQRDGSTDQTQPGASAGTSPTR